jgi:hypothetical protein
MNNQTVNLPTGQTGNPQLDQLVSFIQHDIPGLDDGRYQLQVAQQITDAEKNTVSDGSLAATYTFGIAGDRFRLSDPSSMVYSVFPASEATGEFDTVLPSVVFTKTSFPWSRIPTNTIEEMYQGNKPEPGKDTDFDIPTWLTIILLDEDDITNYAAQFPKFALPPATVTIGDLFLTAANPNSSLGSNYSYFNHVTTAGKPLSTYMDPGDTVTDTIRVLDLPMGLFAKIAPTIEDLKIMAHVRKVSLLDKATMPGISDVGEPLGSFSIVFGNRLPNTHKKTYAYLVSLEQMQDFLPTNAEGGLPVYKDGTSPDPTKTVRLAVLQSWSFFSVGQSATFVTQLDALNNAKAVVPPPPPPPAQPNFSSDPVIVNEDLSANTNLRLVPGPGAIDIVKNALNMGYVPLNHLLRTGETAGTEIKIDHTVSWYRGPLVPYQISKAAIQLPISSPDKAMIFDPSTGMLDTSYAAAWTLGRQLALQDSSFSVALYNWKRGVNQELVNNMEQSILEAQFSDVLAASGQQLTTAQTPDTLLPEGKVDKERTRKKMPKGSLARQLILSLQKQEP